MHRIEPATPDEDRVAFPPEWREYTLDWRGRGTPRAVTVDREAPRQLDELYDRYADDMANRLRLLEDPAYEAPIRAGIAGEADPLKAALALSLLAATVPRGYGYAILAIGRDAWITTHGLAFAAEAVLEFLANRAFVTRAWRDEPPQLKFSDTAIPVLATSRELLRKLRPLRSLIAALSEREHDEVRAAVAARRNCDDQKFVSAMLMPDQEDWAFEACELHDRLAGSDKGAASIWAVVSTPERLARSGVRAVHDFEDLDERLALLLDTLGTDALPVLVGTLAQEDKPPAEVRRSVFDAIARLPSDAALAYLLGDLTNPQAMAAAKNAAQRFPVRALRAIAATAAGAEPVSRARLAGFAHVLGLPESAGALAETERERIETLLESTRRHPVAEDLPPVFASPPWAAFAKPASKPAALDLTAPLIDELRWAPGEREAWTEYGRESHWNHEDAWSKRFPEEPGPDHYLFERFLAYAPEERARPALARWDGKAEHTDTALIRKILGRFGDAAAPTVQAIVKQKPSHREALAPFVNLDAARQCALWLSRSHGERRFAESWFDRHAADAAALLIPDAVGKDAKRRKAATEALRYLARTVVDAQAAAYGPAGAAAVAALLDAHPLDPQLPRLPKPPAWAEPAMLPQLVLENGTALPDAAVRTFLTALAMDDPERPYPGIDLLAAECDPVALTSFSWGLFELWLSAGSPSKYAWAMGQLGRFADDDTVRRLTALVREWPGQSQNRKAIRGLQVLGAIGSEAALRAVHELSLKAKFKALKTTATEQIEVIAERLELSLDRLADRLVPDFGLTAGAATVLDYGARTFTIGFDEHLKPFAVDESGKRYANAPKPGAKDDPALANAAYRRFVTLRGELKSTAADQAKRLEAALVSGRTWSFAEFRRYLVEHPVLWPLSSRLIWEADTEGGRVSFRLAEDRTLADVEEEPIALRDDAVVRLAHPLTLGGEVEAWAAVFADYEILQPFDQLARPAFALSEADLASGRVARFEGVKAGAGPLIGLLKRGWTFGGPRGGYGLLWTFPGGGHLFLDPKPGVHPGPDPGGEQVLERVELGIPEDGAVDPVAVSEALLAVSKLVRDA